MDETAQHQQRRITQGVRIQAWISMGNQQVGRRASHQTGNTQPIAGRPASRRDGLLTAAPDSAQRHNLVHQAAMRDAAACVASCVDRDACLDGGTDGIADPGM